MSRGAAARSNPASCSTNSTAPSSPMGCGSRSISRRLRAPPSAAWRAIIPAARVRCATASPATTSCRSTPSWAAAPRPHLVPVAAGLAELPAGSKLRALAEDMLAIGLRESDEIAARFPKVQRRVGGYNLDALAPNAPVHNLAHILVGSEGTLASPTRIKLRLGPLRARRAVGPCHFARFYDAMAAAQHIV